MTTYHSLAQPRPEDFTKARDVYRDRYLEKTASVGAKLFRIAQPSSPANIVGVGIGEKYKDGLPTGQVCLRVYVVQKIPLEQVPPELLISPIDKDYNVPTDVISVGRPELLINRMQIDPARGGVSIGYKSHNSAGTLGGLVRDATSNSIHILSNKHVFNPIGNAQKGDDIIQPGLLDGGGRDIAKFERECPITSSTSNFVDAAIANVPRREWVSPDIVGIGVPKGICHPLRNRWVLKSGRTTGLTRGYIDDSQASVTLDYDGTVILFDDQLLIRGVPSPSELSSRTAERVFPFSAPGDSGSLVIDEGTCVAVGLVFAGSMTHNVTWANKIYRVLDCLKVELVLA